MTDDEIKQMLVLWLLHHGTEPVLLTRSNPAARWYFDDVSTSWLYSHIKAYVTRMNDSRLFLNEAGLARINGVNHDQD